MNITKHKSYFTRGIRNAIVLGIIAFAGYAGSRFPGITYSALTKPVSSFEFVSNTLLAGVTLFFVSVVAFYVIYENAERLKTHIPNRYTDPIENKVNNRLTELDNISDVEELLLMDIAITAFLYAAGIGVFRGAAALIETYTPYQGFTAVAVIAGVLIGIYLLGAVEYKYHQSMDQWKNAE